MVQTQIKSPHLVVFGGFESAEREDDAHKVTFSRETGDNGVEILAVKNVPVFRSGAFRDSMGFPHEFDDFAMESMVRNYDHLKAQKIFADVPVRNGHPSPFAPRMQGLVGYVTGLKTEKRSAPHDGKEYTYLIADFEILDDDAKKKVESKLWRNRSSEIGVYTDNRENEYGPAFLGVAYVDIPAVEGLNGFSNANQSEEVRFVMEDATMSGAVTLPPTIPGGTPAPAAPFAFSLGGQTGITDSQAVQNYINALETERDDFKKKLADTEAERDTLAAFKKSLADNERIAFVSGLVDKNVVLASQKDSLTALAKGMTDEQFEVWKGSYSQAPSNPIFDQHGKQDSKKPENGDSPENADFEDDKRIVRILASRMTDEQLKATPAYKNVIAKDPAFTV